LRRTIARGPAGLLRTDAFAGNARFQDIEHRTPATLSRISPDASVAPSPSSRWFRPAVAQLRLPVRLAVLAAVLGVTALGLVRPAPAHAAVASPAAETIQSARTVAATTPLKLSAARRAIRDRRGAWRFALRQRHKPYVWGGTGPRGFDCSGLVYSSYRRDHMHLPRTTYGMLSSWHLVRVAKGKARRGDLAFFGSGHVELYDHGKWTYGAADSGSRIGFHRMSRYWHPTMYYRIRV
jgi:cell wall-associated NlpC family hydrolase